MTENKSEHKPEHNSEQDAHVTHHHELHNHQSHDNTPHAHEKKIDASIKDNDESNASNNSKSKKSLIAVITIIGIIIIIFGGIILLSKYVFKNTNTVEYNHYVFQKFEGNKWMTQQLIRGKLYNIPFYNNPNQVTDIQIDPTSVAKIRQFSTNPNGTIYITVDPDESSRIVLAGVEYARILGTSYDIYNMNVKSAISTPYNNTISIPVITCKNQSKDVLVIYQHVTDKNLVSTSGNCIIIESKNATEGIRMADAFAFRLLNIIPE